MIKKNLLGIIIIGWGIIVAILRLTEVVPTSWVGFLLIIGFGIILGIKKLLEKKHKADDSDPPDTSK